MPKKPYRAYVSFFMYIKMATDRNLVVDSGFYATSDDLNLFFRINKLEYLLIKGQWHYPNLY